MKLFELGEHPLIERIARRIRTDPTVIRGIGDDCAVLKGPPGKYLLLASDMLVEGVHFLSTVSAWKIGFKALAVNVSDIAAMGGIPRYAVISLGLPRETPLSFVDGLYQGLTRCARRFSVNVVGGDTDRSPHRVIDVAILGEVEKNRVVLRSGARPGDRILVTGRLGGSLRSGRHLTFTPRLREARALTSYAKPSAMIDLSDGLGPDLLKLCEASGVSARLEAAQIPRHRGCSIQQALTDGEDFELLLTASPKEAARLLRAARRRIRCGLTQIGEVLPSSGKPTVRIVATNGIRLPRSLVGFRHF